MGGAARLWGLLRTVEMADEGHVRSLAAPREAMDDIPLKPCLELLQSCGKARAKEDKLLEGNISSFGEPCRSPLLSVASDTLGGPVRRKDEPSQLNL